MPAIGTVLDRSFRGALIRDALSFAPWGGRQERREFQTGVMKKQVAIEHLSQFDAAEKPTLRDKAH